MDRMRGGPAGTGGTGRPACWDLVRTIGPSERSWGAPPGTWTGQKPRLQESILPVSPPALSFTRSFQVPFAASEEALTV
ncbi:hypothetical protein Sros01_58290 [Streptomyces roseochromogenus]|nr:hypothetical protein Slala05_26880 [Streptomyces lavendulae subsp. lavendulae]GLX39756.1 hypothetical protein Sros01_58290 [Streptomyces roseochromogenus]